jgi:hypothetical protein
MTIMVFLYYIGTSMYMIICSLMIIDYAFSANILFIYVHHGFPIASVISIMFLLALLTPYWEVICLPTICMGEDHNSLTNHGQTGDSVCTIWVLYPTNYTNLEYL